VNWKLFTRYFIDALFAVKFKLFVLFIIILALLTLYLVFEKPNYKTSWVLLLPGTERNSTINLDNLGEARSSGAGAYGRVSISPKNTYKEIALSDAVINKAARRYGIESTAFSKPRIRLIDQTPAMKFTLVGESKDELTYRSTLYNDTFHETLDGLRQNEIERNFQGIENNLSEAKNRLAQARLDVVQHQTNSQFISDEQFKRWVNDTENLRAKATEIEIQIAEFEARIVTSLGQLRISSVQAEAILVLLSNPSVKMNLERLGQQLTEQASVRAKFASQNPTRKKVEREVSALTQELRSVLSNVPEIEKITTSQLMGLLSEDAAQRIQIIAQWLAQYDGLNAQRQSLKKNQQQYQERIKNQTINAAKLADLQRDHQIAEAIFSSALAKLDTSRLDIYATYPLTQLLTHPGATITRDRLKSKLMIIAGVLIFGMLAMALILNNMRVSLLESNKRSSPNTKPYDAQFESNQNVRNEDILNDTDQSCGATSPVPVLSS